MANFGANFFLCALILFCSLFHYSNGSQCTRGRKLYNLIPNDLSCPGLGDDDDKSFCCPTSDDGFYCCDVEEFARTQGFQFVLPVVIGVAIGILAGCFLCCLCCPCCMLYKRRHQGTVYGRVQQPATVVNIQTNDPNSGFVPSHAPAPMPMQMPMPQTSGGFVQQTPIMPYPQYPGTTIDHTGQSQVPPPPYSAAVATEGYAKQAPFNPNFYGN